MFTVEQREHVRKRFLELAQSDPSVTAGALTGSMAFGSGDQWSDIDVAFGIAEGITPEAVLDDWTHIFEQEWGLLDHFDLRYGSSVYRVFLLPSGLEVDVAATPAEDFTIGVTGTGNAGELRISWDTFVWTAPITVK